MKKISHNEIRSRYKLGLESFNKPDRLPGRFLIHRTEIRRANNGAEYIEEQVRRHFTSDGTLSASSLYVKRHGYPAKHDWNYIRGDVVYYTRNGVEFEYEIVDFGAEYGEGDMGHGLNDWDKKYKGQFYHRCYLKRIV